MYLLYFVYIFLRIWLFLKKSFIIAQTLLNPDPQTASLALHGAKYGTLHVVIRSPVHAHTISEKVTPERPQKDLFKGYIKSPQ